MELKDYIRNLYYDYIYFIGLIPGTVSNSFRVCHRHLATPANFVALKLHLYF